MKAYKTFLKKKSTKKLNLKSLKRNTFEKAKINGVSGNFILDTGASNSCVGFESIEYSAAEASKTKASCRTTGMFTQTASNNKLQLEFGKIHHSI
jgi:predicted aspartyl protease